jgi:hypothetical protein
VRQRALAAGYRSGLEEKIAKDLEELEVSFRYENKKDIIAYTTPPTPHKYTPDFVIPNGIIIETKGIFSAADRKKHLLIKQQHPDKDIRFVFNRSKSFLTKAKSSTYASWCEKHGFMFADKSIPEEWLC